MRKIQVELLFLGKKKKLDALGMDFVWRENMFRFRNEREKKKKCSARCGARTHDPEIKSLMLYRLS